MVVAFVVTSGQPDMTTLTRSYTNASHELVGFLTVERVDGIWLNSEVEREH